MPLEGGALALSMLCGGGGVVRLTHEVDVTFLSLCTSVSL